MKDIQIKKPTMRNKSNDYYNKKIDIELKKKELEEKYDAHFSDKSSLTPEIENEWLNSIEEFEKQFQNAERITVFDYLKKPAFKKALELNEVELSAELDNLFQLLHNGNISLDTLSDVDDNELYRFITEELFEHEVDNMAIPGMTMCFIYEEFHPNSKLDIEQAFDHFLNGTMGKMKNIIGDGYDMTYIDTENYKNANGVILNKELVSNKINNFLSSFDSFKIISNEINELSIDEEKQKAQIHFTIDYNGIIEKSKEVFQFKGKGCFKLKPSEYGGWDIYHIDMPGLKI